MRDVGGRWGVGCSVGLVATAVAALLLVGVAAWYAGKERAAAEAAALAEAEAMAQPARDNLRPADEPWDVDRTMRVIHAMDGALRDGSSLRDYLTRLAGMDLRGVHPGVLASRDRMLDVLLRSYAKRQEADARDEMWDTTSEMVLAAFSVVHVSGSVGLGDPNGAVSVDREQAQKLLAEWRDERDLRADLERDLAELEVELLDAVAAGAEAHHEVMHAWDELSLVRDRAWLAAAAGDWAGARAAAEVAVARSPGEREAHLIAAWAMIESGDPEALGQAEALLDDYVAHHPDSSAPALLLQGAALARAGDVQAARRAFEQSAAWYPRQAAALGDLVDPYAQRAWLRQSREGSFILEMYTATMLGAGDFSPDLHLARIAFGEGDAEGGRRKVLDHFARRRAQGQWDFVLADLAAAERILGADGRTLFPEDAWLDLQVDPPLVGDGLKLAVVNRGDITLHNATLVLAVHFTDTFPGDYVGLRVPETAPSVPAGERTSFGTLAVAVPHGEAVWDQDDVVEVRAVVVSDEAVLWVDTERYKVAEAEAFRARRASRDDALPAGPTADPVLTGRATALLREAAASATLVTEEGYLRNDVVVRIPRAVALARPLFRLLAPGSDAMAPSENRIDGEAIVLRFSGVSGLGDPAARGPLTLQILSGWGEARARWAADGAGWVSVPP